MKNLQEIIKWENIFQKNKIFKKQLKKIEKAGAFDSSFYQKPSISNFSIYGEYGVGFGKINAIVIKKILDVFFEQMENKNGHILVCSDENLETLEITKSVSKINDNLNLVFFKDFEGFDKKFVSFCVKKAKLLGAIYISKSIFNKNILNVFIYDSNAKKLDKSKLNEIVEKIENNINNIEYKSYNKNNVSFLNNDLLIKTFVDRISVLFSKKTAFRKTKIAISCRTKGIASIISSLVGNKDFAYTINKKTINKDLDIFSKSHLSDFNIKKYFWKQILFAKLNNCNFLIEFNKEGTQLFIFLIQGWKIIYLNEKLIPLIFLHKFYNDIFLENKSIPNLFVASNEDLTKNLIALFRKFQIEYRKISDNNFNTHDYMLLFWNDYNQFVFGENVNDEFTIYHILIKITEIIDYYNNQYNSIKALFNNTKKMYGFFEEENKYFLNLNIDSINNIINKFVKSELYSKNIANYNRIQINENDFIESNLWKIELKSGYTIFIKYNYILQKTIIKIRFIEEEENVFKKIINRFKKYLTIKKFLIIIKKKLK